MASVNLRPGDILNIHWTSIQDTPLGIQEVDSSFAFSYEELFSKLKTKTKTTTTRRSGTNGARFSRMVALATNALRKGIWSTGAEIDRDIVFSKLMLRFQELDPSEYPNITSNAKDSINKIISEGSFLRIDQKIALQHMADAITYPKPQSNIA